MKIHNIVKNPNVLPENIDGSRNESDDVYLVYRVLTRRGADDKWGFETAFGKGFYSHDEKLWYAYHDDYKCRMVDLFDENGGQKWDSIDNLREDCVPDEIIGRLTKVPEGFAYHNNIDDNTYFTTEIVGWYTLPTWEEFNNE